MPAAPTLDDLARTHGTDKGSQRHGFAEVYDRFLEPYREAPVQVLELGVKGGASLRMWRDYFPHGTIHGVDVDAAAAEHEGERINVVIGDQKDPDVLQQVLDVSGPPDVVIDDGSHRYAEQKGSLLWLWPRLKPQAVYVMEDVHTSYLPKYEMGLDAPETTVKFLKQVVDDLHAHLHPEPEILPGLASIHFHYGTCVLIKSGSKPRKKR